MIFPASSDGEGGTSQQRHDRCNLYRGWKDGLLRRNKRLSIRSERGSGLTLSALLLGKVVFALAAVNAAARGDFESAAWGIVLAAILDLVDRPRREPDLRATGTRQRLKIGMNALCFGVAPAFIAHEAYLEAEPWGWVLASLYAVTAAIGVTRSKVEPDRRSKPTTQGLPASAGGVLLATIYPFFTAAAVAPLLGGLPSAQETGGLMICLLILMVSPIPYPIAPKLSFRRGRRALPIFLVAAAVTIAVPEYVVFPLFALYTFWGIAESLTPALAGGILGGAGEEDRSGSLESSPDEASEATRSYRARSTWE